MAVRLDRKSAIYALAAVFWLPAAVVLSTLARGFGMSPDPAVWISLWPTLPAGLPLAAACILIHRTGRPRGAKTVFLLAGFITVLAAVVGGLFGPLGILAYCFVASLPAWLALAAFLIADFRKRER